jgi:hypothetical protein
VSLLFCTPPSLTSSSSYKLESQVAPDLFVQ